MKKISLYLSLIFILIVVLGGCLFCLVRYQQIMYSEPYIWYPSIRVFQTNNGYSVYFLKGMHIEGSLHFSASGQFLRRHNVVAIYTEDAEVFLGKTIEEIADKYGPPHGDVGSGFYHPAYVSNDFHLFVLYTDNNKVNRVVVKDLMENSVIEEYSSK